VENAVNGFLAVCETNGIKESTIRKYRNPLKLLAAFAKSNNTCCVADIEVSDLDIFRAGRHVAPITSLKELETLRQFWTYCMARNLCKENVAQKIKGPTITSPNDVEPYSVTEVDQIIAASTLLSSMVPTSPLAKSCRRAQGGRQRKPRLRPLSLRLQQSWTMIAAGTRNLRTESVKKTR
jgi:site-specific recombinase XerD